MTLTIGSLFDGLGGFPLAGQRVGIKTLWASEIEKFPIEVTKIRFPDMKHYGDITKLNGAGVEPVDIVTGGSPCQDLSVAGKRAGMAGARSGLFMEMVRVIKEMRDADRQRTNEFIRPRYMLWENVPGAFSSNKGEDFRAILEETARVKDASASIPMPANGRWGNAGLIMGDNYSIAWRIFDAQYWGVPQRRRRIYLVADFAGGSAGKILFVREGLSRHSAQGGEAGEGTAAGVEGSIRKSVAPTLTSYNLDSRSPQSEEQQRIIGAVLKARTETGIGAAVSIENYPTDGSCKIQKDGKVQTLTSRAGTGGNNVPMVMEQSEPKTLQIRSGCEGGGKGALIQDNKSAALACNNTQTLFEAKEQAIAQTYAFQRSDEFKASDQASSIAQRDYKSAKDLVCAKHTVRRLTPLEEERLQDYPDGWTDIPGASDSARYKALGNSIAVCCAEYVLEGISKEVDQI